MKAASRFWRAVGRRKAAVAAVQLTAGRGQFWRDGEPVTPSDEWRKPLSLAGADRYDVSIHVRGGGIVGQNQAVALAIARALLAANEQVRTTLRKAGLLTVDARVKERKKPGLKRARKAPQWAKR